MGKLVESTFMSLDGTINEPQRWSPPYWDDEHAAYASELLSAADALLLGRKTYEVFAKAWPERSGDPFTDRMNAMPKYVASNTLNEATWNSTVIQGDVNAEVARLKQDQNLLKYGTGELSKSLLGDKLVDEYHIWVFPVVAGTGEHLFDGLDRTHLQLTGTTTFKSGIVVLRYTTKP